MAANPQNMSMFMIVEEYLAFDRASEGKDELYTNLYIPRQDEEKENSEQCRKNCT